MASRVLGYARQHHLAVLALFLSVGGGTSYAAVSAATPSAKSVYVCAASGKPLTLSSAKAKCKAKRAKKVALAAPAVGATGPAGAAGPGGAAGAAGQVGPKGDTGDTGAKGDPGTANVITSDWFSATTAAASYNDDASAFMATSFNVPALTSSVISTAAIQVFMRFSGDAHPLPYTSYAGGKVSTVDFAASVGKLQIRRFTHDNTGSIPLSSALQFRYVIIPRGTLGASGT
ncbi:MAG TPA: hypothetical protein VI318_07870 [Baekduia sp.]